jgi:D-3-phosphoglycerate dehydrogenase / 2-oxoglutarate reductase
VGAVGSRLAAICQHGFDMRVLGHQRDLSRLPDYAQGTDLDTLFAESDFVVLCCPITPQTHHLADARRLARMRSSAFLLNLGRGALVDTPALIDALHRNRLAGAGLDVFEQEPLPPAHPLLQDERVILTPHIAARSNESVAYVGDMAVTQVLQLLNDQAPQYLVNPEAWADSSARRRTILSALQH